MSRKDSRNLILIIDPQVDFHEGGSLAVPGALADSARIAKLIQTKKFHNIVVTLDTHQYVDIGHPMWWINEEKEHPKPVTIITTKDIDQGKWRAARQEDEKWSNSYVRKLEANKRFQHTVWPYHCIVGTPGHGVVPVLNEALEKWAKANRQLVTYMWKGTNPKAEMYSAFKADVEVPGADETKLNKQVLDRLYRYDNLVVCGEAASHCVMNSVIDMVAYFDTKDGKNGKPPQISLLSDCCSPVTGYKKQTDDWFKEIQQSCKYLNVVTSSDLTMIEDL